MMQFLVVLFLLALPFAYDASPTLRYYAKFCFYYTYLNVAGLLLLPILAMRPRNVVNIYMASNVFTIASRFLGLRYTLRGAEHLSSKEACVLVANHQSSLDILAMLEIIKTIGRVNVVAQREILYFGTFGLSAWMCDFVFINRSDPVSTKEIISTAMTCLQPKKSKLWMFPEETRRNTGEIHTFQKGAFHVAVDAQIPIVPIVLSRYYFLDSELKTFEPGDIILTVLPPIETCGLTAEDVGSLSEKTRSIMIDTFKSCKPPSPVIGKS